jgi:hypothetical protein
MICTCPICGARASLEVITGHADAAAALETAFALSPVGRAFVKYLGLFRPAKNALGFDRVAKLVGELLPEITAQRVSYGGVSHDAPPEAWAWAIEQMLNARAAGALQLPMKNHRYLRAVIAGGGWRGDSAMPAVPNVPQKTTAASSSTARQLSGLAALRAGREQ